MIDFSYLMNYPEMTEEMHQNLIDAIGKTENANKELVTFLKIKCVDSFPYRTKIDGIDVSFDHHLGLSCDDCSRNELCLYRTVVKDFASCMEVWTIAYCIDCRKWIGGRIRFYPRDERYMIMVGGVWKEHVDDVPWWKMIVNKVKFMVGV